MIHMKTARGLPCMVQECVFFTVRQSKNAQLRKVRLMNEKSKTAKFLRVMDIKRRCGFVENKGNAIKGAASETLVCGFCKKNQFQVAKLIHGGGSAYICDECVSLCSDIIAE